MWIELGSLSIFSTTPGLSSSCCEEDVSPAINLSSLNDISWDSSSVMSFCDPFNP